RDRGRDRRGERVGHARRARRALRALAAPPAPRARRARPVEVGLHSLDERPAHRGGPAAHRRDGLDERRLQDRRGRPRAAPAPRGTSTRPTADQIRVALMDTLTPWLSDARVLDLFAGAGGVGLEALSRGALHATFVEREARAVAALDANIRSLGVEAQARVLRLAAGRALRRLAADGP